MAVKERINKIKQDPFKKACRRGWKRTKYGGTSGAGISFLLSTTTTNTITTDMAIMILNTLRSFIWLSDT
jgi:hypothetical protein